MQDDVPAVPWATIGVWLLTLIAAIVGGVVVIWGDPGALSFEDYIEILGGFAVAHGLLGIGRGINANGEGAGGCEHTYATQLYIAWRDLDAPALTEKEPPRGLAHVAHVRESRW
jgi:hypothetical protein